MSQTVAAGQKNAVILGFDPLRSAAMSRSTARNTRHAFPEAGK